MVVWVPGQQVATGISQASRQDAVPSIQEKVPKMDALQDMSSPTSVGTHPPHIPNDTREHVSTKTYGIAPIQPPGNQGTRCQGKLSRVTVAPDAWLSYKQPLLSG